MIAGHFGFAAGVKSRQRQVPLWALMLATQWMDVIFVPLYLSGIERIVPLAGTHGGYGEGTIYADYTHSLVGALVIAATFGLVFAIPWGRRVGTVLGAVVFSHWLLDLIVHRADLPILPGNLGGLPRLGFGLWQVPAAAAALELALVLGGSYLYWRAALETAQAAGGARRGTANLAGALVLASGLLTLTLNLLGF
jgi:hypothetical protein